MVGPLSFLSGPSISHFLSPVPGRIPRSRGEGGTGGSLAHFLGMLPPKVRFPCPLACSPLRSARRQPARSLSGPRGPSLPPVPASARSSNDVFLHVEHASSSLTHCLLFRLLLLVFVVLRSVVLVDLDASFFLFFLFFSFFWLFSSSGARGFLLDSLRSSELVFWCVCVFFKSCLRSRFTSTCDGGQWFEWPVIRLLGLGQGLLGSKLPSTLFRRMA